MIFHYMKDGTRRDTIDGYIVKYEQKKELYKKLTYISKNAKTREINTNDKRRNNHRTG